MNTYCIIVDYIYIKKMTMSWRIHRKSPYRTTYMHVKYRQPRQYYMSIKSLTLTVLQRAQTYNITFIMLGFSALLYLKLHTEGEIKEAS